MSLGWGDQFPFTGAPQTLYRSQNIYQSMSVSRSPSPLHFAMLTHAGRARSGNEDACAASPEAGAYVVCDGMGGAAAGEIASRLAVDTFLDRIELPSTALVNSPASKPQTRLHAAILAANSAVQGRAGQSAELSGMGTTLIALLHVPGPVKDRRSVPRPGSRSLPPPTLFLANVGDSRCYRRRSGALLQLSTDHSFVEEQVRAGQITPDQAAISPMRNYITRAIGSQPHVEPDIQSYRPKAGDLYLLTSDGLTRELENPEIASILHTCIPEPAGSGGGTATKQQLQDACQALIEAANTHGGRDNITVLLLLFA